MSYTRFMEIKKNIQALHRLMDMEGLQSVHAADKVDKRLNSFLQDYWLVKVF